jgi:hypothetical protein
MAWSGLLLGMQQHISCSCDTHCQGSRGSLCKARRLFFVAGRTCQLRLPSSYEWNGTV